MKMIQKKLLNDLADLPEEMQAEAFDFVQLLKAKLLKTQAYEADKKEPNGRAIANIMARMATRGDAFYDIEDPAVWQRKIRQDRPLPSR